MILISHRGNTNGCLPEKENDPSYIYEAFNNGFYVEIDVWYLNNELFTGHDSYLYKINLEFLLNHKLLCHAKNHQAFELLLENKKIHSFWHQNDDYNLSSKGHPIVYPGKPIIKNSIVMIKEPHNYSTEQILLSYGICSDFIQKYK